MKYIFSLLLGGICINTVSAQYSQQPAFPHLPAFTQPLEMQTGGARGMIYVVEQTGRIYIFSNDSAVKVRKIFLDLSNVVTPSNPTSETGLLGLAFHPNFKTNGYFYVNYTSNPGGQLTSHISRFQVNPTNPDTVLTGTEQILLTLAQPYANHNGGHLAFGNDGYLYASFGDGGSGGDPGNRAQNIDTLFGKILRLDVDHEANGLHYAIPTDNPFASTTQGQKKEIYAYGLRNVWKFSFDRETGKLWAGDVGQNNYEEIDTIKNGGNYGWNKMEGFHCYPSGGFNCDSTGFIPPLWEYSHAVGDVAIVGGFVYRGNVIPSLFGKYIYGDYASNRVWALDYDGLKTPTNQLLLDKTFPTLNLSSMGEDENHELYLVGYTDGKIYRLASSEPNDNTPPQFTNHIHAGIDTIFVSDNASGDLGLESITWDGINGVDASKFTVFIISTLLPCMDTVAHEVVVKQNDVAIGGCLQFTFTDCAGNQSLDTICFVQHSLRINPDTIDFGTVPTGTMASSSVGISIVPEDGEVFLIDSIIILPPSARSAFVIMPSLPLPFYAGSTSALVEYFPHNFFRDTALVIFHIKNTIDSIHYLHLFGRGQFVGSVSSSLSSGLSLITSPNPFSEKTRIQYITPLNGELNLVLYDMLGKETETIIHYPQESGTHSIEFDGSNLPAGSYILRLESNGKVISRRIIKE